MIDNRIKVLLLDTKYKNPNHYICRAIFAALKRAKLVKYVFIASYDNAISLAQNDNYDLFLAFDGEELDVDICSRISHLCKVSVLWVTEDPYEIKANKTNASLFDIVYTNNLDSVSEYSGKACHLPFAADLDFHYHNCDNTKKFLYDVFFVGTAWPNRVEFVNELIQKLPNLKYKIALPYNQYLPKPDLKIPESNWVWKTSNYEFCRFASLSKFTLTLHRNFSSSGENTVASTPGPRIFEVGMAGGAQLIDMTLPEVSLYYEPGKEFLGFTTIDECIDLINTYIDDDEAILKIATAAQNKTIETHKYDDRVSKIIKDTIQRLSIVEEKVSKKINKRKILYVVHNFETRPPYGGVELFVQNQIQALSENYEAYILAPDQNKTGLVLLNSRNKKINKWNFSLSITQFTVLNNEREAVFKDLIREYNFEIVHFHHLLHSPFSYLRIAKEHGVKVVYSAHDYYLICDEWCLIDYKGDFCNVGFDSIRKCAMCNNVVRNKALEYAQIRKNTINSLVNYIDVIQYNHEVVKRIYEDVYPALIDKSVIIPIENPKKTKLITKIFDNKNLKIAFVGNFTKQKGADVFIHAINLLRNTGIEFYILGYVNANYLDIIDVLKFENLTVHGEYSNSDLQNLLNTYAIDISLHISIWPETYCISLSECMDAGVIPIVSDIGAHGARILDGINGFKCSVDEPYLLANKILEIKSNQSVLNTMRKNMIDSIVDFNTYELYNALYDNLPNGLNQYKRPVLAELNKAKYIAHNKLQNIHEVIVNNVIADNKDRVVNNKITKVFRYYKSYGLVRTIKRAYHELRS